MYAVLLAVLLAIISPFCHGFVFIEPDTHPGEQFGYAAFCSGNMVAVSAPLKATPTDPMAGAVYVYTCTTTSCTLLQKLVDPQAPVPSQFGSFVAFRNGKLAIGAFNNYNGGMYIYECNPITGCEIYNNMPIVEPNLPPESFFGVWPSIDENLVAFGAPYYLNGTGALFVYNCDSTSRTCTPFSTNPLMAHDGKSRDILGFANEIRGDLLVSGMSRKNQNSGAFYAWKCTAANGGVCTPFANNPYSHPDLQPSDAFGSYVTISGNKVFATAPNWDHVRPGAIYVYNCQNLDCTFTTSLSNPAGQNATFEYGDFATTQGKYFFTGAQFQKGVGYGFIYSLGAGGQMNLVSAVTDPNGKSGDNFGWGADLFGPSHVMFNSPFSNNGRGGFSILPINPVTQVKLGVRWATVGKVYATFRGTLGNKTVKIGDGLNQGFQTISVPGLTIGDITSVSVATYSRDKLFLASLEVERGSVWKKGTLVTHGGSVKGQLITFDLSF